VTPAELADRVSASTGRALSPGEALAILIGFEERGLVERCPDGWRLTAHGWELARDLVPPADAEAG
jgi:hypothetical protein